EDMVDPDLVGDVAGDQQLDGLTDIALGCERGASESQINENYAIANDVEKHLDALVGLSAMKIGLAEQIQKVPWQFVYMDPIPPPPPMFRGPETFRVEPYAPEGEADYRL